MCIQCMMTIIGFIFKQVFNWNSIFQINTYYSYTSVSVLQLKHIPNFFYTCNITIKLQWNSVQSQSHSILINCLLLTWLAPPWGLVPVLPCWFSSWLVPPPYWSASAAKSPPSRSISWFPWFVSSQKENGTFFCFYSCSAWGLLTNFLHLTVSELKSNHKHSFYLLL